MAARRLNPLQHYIAVQQPIDREMAKILVDAAKEAEAIVLETAGKKGVGAAVERNRMRQASRELRKLSEQMYGGPITRTMQKGMRNAAAAAANSERYINDVLETAVGGRIPALEQAYAFNAINSVETLRAKDANSIALSQQVYKTRAYSSGQVEKTVQRALALQQSAAQLATSVRDLIRPSVPGGVSYAANRLARTEVNNAFHRAQIDRRSAEPWTLGMKWHLSSSHPRPDECNDYAESSHYKDGPAGVFKTDNVPGKPHPQCLCYLTTETLDEEEFINNFLKGDYDTYIDHTIYSSGIGTTC